MLHFMKKRYKIAPDANFLKILLPWISFGVYALLPSLLFVTINQGWLRRTDGRFGQEKSGVGKRGRNISSFPFVHLW